VPKKGKYSKFTDEDIELLGIAVSKISAGLTGLMSKYPAKIFLKTCLEKTNSRRARLMVRLLNTFVNPSKFRNNQNRNQDLRPFLREIAQFDVFDETDLVSSWGNKGKTLSSKEETAIMHSFKDAGIIENIIGKKNIENEGLKLNQNGGYPSKYRLTKESDHLIQIQFERTAFEFIINSLSRSKLLFILYWYFFSSLFYFIRDCDESKIKLFNKLEKILDPDYREPFIIREASKIKPILASIDDQQMLKLTKELTTEVMKVDGVNSLNHRLLIISLFKLNRALD
jgi:hypothetical protein